MIDHKYYKDLMLELSKLEEELKLKKIEMADLKKEQVKLETDFIGIKEKILKIKPIIDQYKSFLKLEQ